MIALEPITSRNVSLFREVRLRALRDSPSAFGSTYAKEAQLTDAEWLERTARWNGDKGIGFLAMDGSAGCGIAGAFLEEQDATQAHLISMWTAPAHRRHGVGRILVNVIADWARERSAQTLRLMVTSSNDAAIEFYARLGFSRTGRTEPYPNDAALVEYEMVKPLQ
ncbi:MAG TPA: GNAT family N-acetyltransferase [Acidobacteriaceae bacterium]|jgi:ribosomal protein S18 acetylase RimI-like enzyme